MRTVHVQEIRAQFSRQFAPGLRKPSALYLRPQEYETYVKAHGQPVYEGVPVRVCS